MYSQRSDLSDETAGFHRSSLSGETACIHRGLVSHVRLHVFTEVWSLM